MSLRTTELLLTLDGGHAVFEDAIKKSLKSLENIVSAEYGKKVRIKLVTSQKKAPQEKRPERKGHERACCQGGAGAL